MTVPVLYIVIPCYNEEEALPITAKRLTELTDDMIRREIIAPASRILLVDDGSKDRTWQVISSLHAADRRFEGVKLAHNAGHMNALWAGMTMAEPKCDCVITIDADLQDDVEAMYGFLEHYRNGADVVSGVRSSREKDTFFKRTTAQGFYRLMNRLGVEMVYNHADYRLLSKRALQALLSFGEVNMFLRGMVPMLGFRTATVEYERGERVAGESKYPLKKMLSFAFDGITSFSVKPMRLILVLGAVIFVLSLVVLLWTLIARVSGRTVSGWTSLMCSIWMIGGIQLLSLGVIGEYIGKIYAETKARPRFIIERVLDDADEE